MFFVVFCQLFKLLNSEGVFNQNESSTVHSLVGVCVRWLRAKYFCVWPNQTLSLSILSHNEFKTVYRSNCPARAWKYSLYSRAIWPFSEKEAFSSILGSFSRRKIGCMGKLIAQGALRRARVYWPEEIGALSSIVLWILLSELTLSRIRIKTCEAHYPTYWLWWSAYEVQNSWLISEMFSNLCIIWKSNTRYTWNLAAVLYLSKEELWHNLVSETLPVADLFHTVMKLPIFYLEHSLFTSID